MTDRTTKASAPTGSHNLASLPPAERKRIEAQKLACLIRYRLRGLDGEVRAAKGRGMLRAVPEAVRDAVVAELKGRPAGDRD